jgi:glycosyltransferase involved in cell wall biosynthesis
MKNRRQNPFPHVSVIIAVYRRDDFLRLVLESLRRQAYRDFDVVVAEDDRSERIAACVRGAAASCFFPLRHVTQAHEGFGKSRILNAAIKTAPGPALVFIDGDCVLHGNYLYEFAKRAGPDVCLYGRRASLDENTTRKLLEHGDLRMLHPLRLVRTKTRHVEQALYIPWFSTTRKLKPLWGCSFCVFRETMLAINGFDEDFGRPYFGEDSDIQRRLMLHGTKQVFLKNKVIQYHLYHERADKDASWEQSAALYLDKGNAPEFCANGIVKGPAEGGEGACAV